MPRVLRALGWLAVCACAGCQLATAPVASPAGAQQDAPPFEVGIDGVYLTQSVQDYAGTVPLVDGRAGLLRIFLRARQPGHAAPGVRVHVVDTATGGPLNSYTAQSPLTEVPTFIVEGALGGSWNVAIPGADVRPGRHVVVDIDAVPGVPADEVRQTFRYPAQGSLDVRPAQQLLVTLVPIVQSGLAPEVVSGARTADGWIDRARWIHPLGGVDVVVSPAYTTATALGLDGSGWADLLAELDRKRVADGSARTYLGVVKVAYEAGAVGRGAMGGHVALAWDEARSYQRVAAHELGHNFGLKHAPCGNADPSSGDPDWPAAPPYADAHIGVFGWDPVSGVLKDPAGTWDHMSYCGDVHTTWTSDHNYRAAMDFLAGEAPQGAAAAALDAAAASGDAAPARVSCLLVSGRVVAGEVELDPTYVVETRPTPPSGGDHAVELLDRAGAVLGSFPFAPVAAAEEEAGSAHAAHFAMAIPLPAATREAVQGVAIRRRGVEVARRVSAGAPAAALEVRAGQGRAALRWDHGRRPEMMVRDPRSGEVLQFARGGAALVHTDAPELEVVMSDGVRSDPPLRARTR